jgi:hypothetical protein
MKHPQAPAAVLMVRPALFGFNPHTAHSNAFQSDLGLSREEVSKLALKEFDQVVEVLRANDVEAVVVEDTVQPPKPDAVFPNNWISFHGDGKVILYPMLAENRRSERDSAVLDRIKLVYKAEHVFDFSHFEKRNLFLEGTGSVVFDYVNKIAYACRSPRTSEVVLTEVCSELGCRPILFDAVDEQDQPVYHTNVLMCVGTEFAVICLDAIHAEDDQERVLESFSNTGHKVIAISYAQMRAFAGNMLEVVTNTGNPIVLVSQTAFSALLPGQIHAISTFVDMIPLTIPTIEAYGGGSVRCILAGIFNEKRPV